MKWEGRRQSSNVEDRRSGGGAPMFGGRNIGIGTIVIALIGGWVLGVNPLTLLGLLSGGGAPVVQQQSPAQAPPANDTMARFVSTVLADTEDVWGKLFQQAGAVPWCSRYSMRHRAICDGTVLLPGRPEGLY